MERHILLLTDLSEEAQRAFHPVSNLARMIGAKITLLYVLPETTPVQGALLGAPIGLGDPEEERRKAMELLEQQAELLDAELEKRLEILAGPHAARTIAAYAEDENAGLIALSTHGRGGLRRMILGSVAEEILRRSRVPVLCFPPPATTTG